MKIYGHPWSINTRKVQMALAEKGKEAELSLVMIPKGEQKLPAHVALHPFAKVPVLEDEGFVLYESSAITRYLEQKFPTPALVPSDARGVALTNQWIGALEAYFVPHVVPLIIETLFRRYLGGEANLQAIESGYTNMQTALDAVDRALERSPYLAGESFSLAEIHFMPYLEYLEKIGRDQPLRERENLSAWWQRISRRPTWQKVARTGPQPYDSDMTAEVIEQRARAQSA